MSGTGKLGLKTQGNALFLLRTYNDIDHIVPVIWKMAKMGYKPFFLFVDNDYADDYRIRIAVKAGAKVMHCAPVRWYHMRLRRWLVPRWIRRALDLLVAHTLGRFFLIRYQIAVLASEWSGAYGREMAEYFLRPARHLRLYCVSLPHGYYIWTNDNINRHEVDLWQNAKVKPDFTDRNIFSTYVVQNKEAQRFTVERGVLPEKVKIVGSARFCPEWFGINIRLISDICPQLPRGDEFRLVFFVPDWNYNVNRPSCVSLLERLVRLDKVLLVVKANTRGTGTLSDEERNQLSGKISVQFADHSQHSPCLIRQADAVINFASSIGLEALLQGKPVCNPLFLNGNSTIFDGSGVVFDAKDEDEVLYFVESVRCGHYKKIPPEVWSAFHNKYFLGGSENKDVLHDYLHLLFPNPAV